MAKKIACNNCGKMIQSDFAICPYCGMQLEDFAQGNDLAYDDEEPEDEEYEQESYEDEEEEEESEYEETEEYYEEEEESEDDMEETEDEEYEEEEYFEEDEDEEYEQESYEDEEEEAVNSKKKAIKKKPVKEENLNKKQKKAPIGMSAGDSFIPIDITKNIKKSSRSTQKKGAPKKTEAPYQANHDHYYDDVLPEILDDIHSHTMENILKIFGCVAALFLVIWYLIYFL